MGRTPVISVDRENFLVRCTRIARGQWAQRGGALLLATLAAGCATPQAGVRPAAAELEAWTTTADHR